MQQMPERLYYVNTLIKDTKGLSKKQLCQIYKKNGFIVKNIIFTFSTHIDEPIMAFVGCYPYYLEQGLGFYNGIGFYHLKDLLIYDKCIYLSDNDVFIEIRKLATDFQEIDFSLQYNKIKMLDDLKFHFFSKYKVWNNEPYFVEDNRTETSINNFMYIYN